MPVIIAGKTLSKPICNGHPHNAIYNGKILWPSPKDTVVSIRITTAAGGNVPSTLPVNGSVALAAVATYGDGHTETHTTEGVVWRSLDTGVAVMDGATLRWVHGGTALVTATVNGFTSAALSVACAWAAESITVSPNPVLVRVGESVDLTVRVLPAAASQDVTVSIDDETVAQVAKTAGGGISLTGLAPGGTVLALSAGDARVSVPVTVSEAVRPNLWPAGSLPVSNAGVTFSDAGGGRVRVAGSSTGYAIYSATGGLDGAGEYTIADGEGFNGSLLYIQVKAGGVTVLSPTATTATLTAAQAERVQCQIVVAPGLTGDTTVTPVIRKL